VLTEQPTAAPPTAAQRHELTSSGLPADRYDVLRRAGASHDDVMEAFALGADLRSYAYLRSIRPHSVALREAGAIHSPEHLEAVRLGVTDRELADVRATEAALIDRHWAVLAHGETPKPRETPVLRLADYLVARRAGLAHDDARWFAEAASRMHPRPAARDLESWARCQQAGLDRRSMFAAVRGRIRLKGYQLEALHAGLFAVRSLEHRTISQQELVWVAQRADGGPLDLQDYVQHRLGGHSARRSLRLARAGRPRPRVSARRDGAAPALPGRP
jgi:hypothetical protein